VRAVVTAPVAVLALCDVCFRTIALDVIQPNKSSTDTVAATDGLSTVSVDTVVNRRW